MSCRFLAILFVLVTAVGLYTSWAAPVGGWSNLAFDRFVVADNADPDGLYLPSAVQFDDSGSFPFYVGTPGVPFHLGIYAVAKAFHAAGHCWTESSVGFVEFCIRNWDSLHFAVRFCCSLLIFLCAACFYIVLLQLDFSFVVAATAALLLLFSAPVLIYFNKISPEGMTLLFFLASWLGLARFDRMRHPGWIVLAGVCCALTLFTKVHYTLPLPLLAAWSISRAAPARRTQNVLLFAASLSLVGAPLALLVDWPRWLSGWRTFTNYYYSGLSPFSMLLGSEATEKSLNGGLWDTVVSFAAKVLVPDPARSGSFFVWGSMAALGITAICGLRKQPELRKALFVPFWMALLSLPLAIMRASVHYWFFVILFCCVPSAAYVNSLMRDTDRPLLRAFALSCLLSWPGLLGFVYLKASDIVRYDKYLKPYYEALHLTQYGQRVGIVASALAASPVQIGGIYLGFGINPELPVVRRFCDQFRVVEKPGAEVAYREYLWAFVEIDSTQALVSLVDNEMQINTVAR